MGHTYRGPKSGCKMVKLFGGYSNDGVSAGVWVIHSGPKSGGKLVTLFDCLLYDKLWGPSQRVVTLFLFVCVSIFFSFSILKTYFLKYFTR